MDKYTGTFFGLIVEDVWVDGNELTIKVNRIEYFDEEIEYYLYSSSMEDLQDLNRYLMRGWFDFGNKKDCLNTVKNFLEMGGMTW